MLPSQYISQSDFPNPRNIAFSLFYNTYNKFCSFDCGFVFITSSIGLKQNFSQLWHNLNAINVFLAKIQNNMQRNKN